jgi:hypothetical protein
MPEMFEKRYGALTNCTCRKAWLTIPHVTIATSAKLRLESVHISRGRRERNNCSTPNSRPNFQVTCLMIFCGSGWFLLMLFMMSSFALLFVGLGLANEKIAGKVSLMSY